ncbi:MAG: DEAD/DEAH box helicase, partial [Promethearchaeota archaeon]
MGMLHENQEYCKLLDPRIIKFLESRGYTDFYPPQWEAIKPGLENRNLIISIPTASGKTLIAEIIALQRLFQASQESDIESLPEKTATSTTKTASYKKHKGKKILYLTPLKALAQEKYLEFKQNWLSLGFRVGISTSDIDHPDIRIFQNDLIFLTNEKADSLLRSNPDLMQEIQLVIADEIHLLNDTGRGVTLEFLLTCLRTLNSNIQLIGLSATIQNANELAEWLNAELIESQWRPVELREGFYINGEIQFKNGEVRRVPKIPGHDDVTTLTIDMFKQGGSLLIFANSRRNAMSTAELLSPVLRIIADSSEKATFKNVQTEYQNKIADKSQISKKLEQTLIGGVAFHHAGLSSKQLNFIVSKFNAREIRVICCTPTLAAGVNTPARRVIIKTLYRYSGDEGSKLIPILEYKQMAGRAGRPEFDEYGEVIILGSRPEKLVENALAYINGKPEPITSKLTDEHLLKSHILGLIASQTANTLNSITQILANSFYYYQLNHGNYLSAQLQKVSNKSSNYKSRQRTSNLLKQHSQISKIRKQGGRGEDPLKMFSESDNLFTTASDLLDNQTKITEESSEIGSDSRSDKSTNSPYPQLKISSEQLLNSDKDVKKRISEMLEYFQSNDLIQECDLTEKSNSKQELESESEQKHKLEQKQDHKQDHKQDQKQDQKQEQNLKCTKFGKICVQSYILPDDAVIIRENLAYAAVLNQNHEIALTEVSWLHLIAQLDAFRKPFVQKNNY